MTLPHPASIRPQALSVRMAASLTASAAATTFVLTLLWAMSASARVPAHLSVSPHALLIAAVTTSVVVSVCSRLSAALTQGPPRSRSDR